MFNDIFYVASTIRDNENTAVNKTKSPSPQDLYTAEGETYIYIYVIYMTYICHMSEDDERYGEK